ncbi:uncharacterized protein LOC106880707 isoform X2 [Octopus bimaculoides]|uniref:Uncharacterized protein n=1 Tax=Octopus bimaculoides TaxID=37653 RepID=A0A0L8FWP7_OCTBM|nr:uncharacterized protein LOC106880707 isoform X2 [Octopus bimaculoides]|eukprot:XP_014786269.1 PREDICTED: uncharacterized protein LOC106880707 isoform X2 [Octopus bimaculoides]
MENLSFTHTSNCTPSLIHTYIYCVLSLSLLFDHFDFTFRIRHVFSLFIVAGSRISFPFLPNTCLLRSEMLLVILMLMMVPYNSALVELIDIFPLVGIDFVTVGEIGIICVYDVPNLVEFFLVQNQNHTVVKFKYKKGVYEKTIMQEGFDCTEIVGDKGQVLCWNYNPTCEDATYYTCETPLESSKPKLLKAKSFMKNLELLNPPFEENKTSIFRCTAYVGTPFGRHAFVWIDDTYSGKIRNHHYVNVSTSDKCYVLAESIHNFTVKLDDLDSSVISCAVFDNILHIPITSKGKVHTLTELQGTPGNLPPTIGHTDNAAYCPIQRTFQGTANSRFPQK